MKIENHIKGYGFALIATIAGSTVYIFSKAAFEEVTLPQFGTYWFSLAIIWNTIFAYITPEHRKFKSISHKSFKVLGLMGLIEIIATTSFYAAIAVAANAAIPSFLKNMEYIFVALLGVILLGERFRRLEFLGVILTFIGVFIISYKKDAALIDYFVGSSGLMFLATCFYAIRTIIAKKHIETITPTILAINRALFLFFTAFIFVIVLGQSMHISNTAFINIAIGSFLGPFLTSYGQYNALKYIEASKSAIIQSTTALFVLLGGYLYFGRLPLGYQIAGGIFTILGAILLVVGRKIQRPKVHNSK
ncbi:MAG: DMT family transporter [Salinivirgaceae bacterium]|nr:DMT family transporter [Salinivirgaceae bacterium]